MKVKRKICIYVWCWRVKKEAFVCCSSEFHTLWRSSDRMHVTANLWLTDIFICSAEKYRALSCQASLLLHNHIYQENFVLSNFLKFVFIILSAVVVTTTADFQLKINVEKRCTRRLICRLLSTTTRRRNFISVCLLFVLLQRTREAWHEKNNSLKIDGGRRKTKKRDERNFKMGYGIDAFRFLNRRFKVFILFMFGTILVGKLHGCRQNEVQFGVTTGCTYIVFM